MYIHWPLCTKIMSQLLCEAALRGRPSDFAFAVAQGLNMRLKIEIGLVVVGRSEIGIQ